ncbi:MAG: DUF2231 domain-containing protein [Chloroflexi bacterium]|nr:DUF2231 domain-containing protein [Chloroflexota bacterium]
MESHFKIAGHPAHPMFIRFPVALYPTSLVCDLLYAVTGKKHWRDIAFVNSAAATVMAVLAAVPGLTDWLAIPARSEAKRIGLIHAAMNASLVVLQVVNLMLRTREGRQPRTALPASALLNFLGVATMAVSAYLGEELVVRHRIGIERPGLPTQPIEIRPEVHLLPEELPSIRVDTGHA